MCGPRPGEGAEWGLDPELQAHPTNPLSDLGAGLRGRGQAGSQEGFGRAKVGMRKHHSSSLKVESWSSDNHATPPPPPLRPGRGWEGRLGGA